MASEAPGGHGVEGVEDGFDSMASGGFAGHGVVDVHHPGGVVGPFEVASEPVEIFGDAGEHQAASRGAGSTQVSLLPPPCEELTI